MPELWKFCIYLAACADQAALRDALARADSNLNLHSRKGSTAATQSVGETAHLCAPHSSRAAACTPSAAACWRAPTGARPTGLRSRASAAGSSPGATAAMSTSDGRSTYAAPGRPPTAARTAAASVGAMSPSARARPAYLVNGRTAASWSSSWKLPLPSSLCAARGRLVSIGRHEQRPRMALEHCRRALTAHTLCPGFCRLLY